MRACALILASLLSAFAVVASAADLVSPSPEKVEVTIYRDRPVRTAIIANLGAGDDSGLALITETRSVDLPAGRSRIRFQGVADGIIPQSAAIEGLPAGVVERNFDYDLLDPASMLARSIGQTVTLRRTSPKTGKVEGEPAVVLAAPDGVILQTAQGAEALRCSGGFEGLIFDRLPQGLADRPTLSALADAPAAGRYSVRLSYLSVRLDWSADYVARIAADGKRLDLSGWITLANRSSMSFKDAPTAVVAGRLARVAVVLPRVNAPPLALECWPGQTTHSGWNYPQLPVIVTAERRETFMQKVPVAVSAFTAAPPPPMPKPRAIESQLGDYKLYTLAEPTTVAARQTKQIEFLHQPDVAFETVYVDQVEAWRGAASSPETTRPTVVTLRLQNKPESGLGRPLPAGSVSLRQPQAAAGGRELFIGEAPMRDVPVGEPFEIEAGRAADVTVQEAVVSDQQLGAGANRRERMAFQVTVRNAKTGPVTVEVRQAVGALRSLVIAPESQAHGLKAGDPVWRLPLAPGATSVLAYTLEFAE